VLLSFSRTIPGGGLDTVAEHDGLHIRPGCAEDAKELHALALVAFAGFPGHWHADSRLRKADADELYGRWAADLAKRTDANETLLVAQTDAGEVTGFLAVARDEGGGWNVPLTGVHPRHRGKGTLRHLLVAASSRLARQDSSSLRYETQLTNWPAINVVSRCGFVPTDSRMTFHLWTDLA
jgi:ribosomal protein S18 acetylase RimI-like enzyme